MSFRLASACALTVCTILAGCGQSTPNQSVVRVRSNERAATAPTEPSVPSVVVVNNTASEPMVPELYPSQLDDISTADGSETVRADQYLTDEDTFAVVVRPQQLRESAMLSPLIGQFPVAGHLGVDSSDMDWVCISGTAGALESGREMENITVAARTVSPVDQEQMLRSRFPKAQADEVTSDGLTYVRLTGITNKTLEMVKDEDGRTSAVNRVHSVPAMALYQADSHTFVVCAEARLQDVLRADNGESVRRVLASQDLSAPVVAAITGLQNGVDLPGAINLFVPKLAAVVEQSSAVSLMFHPDHEDVINARIFVQDGHAVDSLADATKECHENTCKSIEGFGALASAELKPILMGLHELFVAADFSQHDDCVELTLSSASGLSKLCEGLGGLVEQAVASR